MSTIDAREIEHFAKDSIRWWDADGPFRPLHKLNPVRTSYIRGQICALVGADTKSLKPFKGTSVLDVGCGGGLMCEPMARLGAKVTGIDADATAIGVAKDHAVSARLNIDYRQASTEVLRAEGQAFDVVLALEIIEHVTDPAAFVADCLALCRPSGLVIFSTLNRTPKSMILGKLAAEYVLGWVPQGTHDWKKFVKPSELAHYVRAAGANVTDIEGLVFNPLKNSFQRSRRDISVNYFMTVGKPA